MCHVPSLHVANIVVPVYKCIFDIFKEISLFSIFFYNNLLVEIVDTVDTCISTAIYVLDNTWNGKLK